MRRSLRGAGTPARSRPARLAAALSLTTAVLAATSAATPATAQMVPFDRSDFGSVVPSQRQSAGGTVLEQSIGTYSNEFISRFSPRTRIRKLGRAVGRLDVLTSRGAGRCTAFIVSQNHIVTNHHCVPGAGGRTGTQRAQQMLFVTGYVVNGVAKGTQTYPVNVVPVEADERFDYAVLEVFGDPSRDWGRLKLAAAALEPGLPFWIIGHPMGEAQRVSRERCRSDDPAVSEGKLRHTCDTLGGNSGSPVIDADTGLVVALHHAGSRRDAINYAIPITEIAKHSKVLGRLAKVPEADEPGQQVVMNVPQPEVPGAKPTNRCTRAEKHFELAREIGTEAALRGHVKFFGDCEYAPLALAMLAMKSGEADVQAKERERKEAEARGEAERERQAERKRADAEAAREAQARRERIEKARSERERRNAERRRLASTQCDRLAADPDDRTKPSDVAGVAWEHIFTGRALKACKAALLRAPDVARFHHQYGLALRKDGRMADAARSFRDAGRMGHARAQYNAGWHYATGSGVPKNDREARRWFQRAADQGDADAQYYIGTYHEMGKGVAEDQREAARWYLKAAKGGSAAAQFGLCTMYHDGRGVRRSVRDGFRWCSEAAEQDHAWAQTFLASMYRLGRGVKRNNSKAAELYRKAADQGHAPAARNLGLLYDYGEGVPRNVNTAARLAIQSASDDDVLKETLDKKLFSRDVRRRIQTMLRQSGHYSGAIDGLFGPATIAALKAAAKK